MTNFKKHAQRAYRASVSEINTKTRNKKSDSIQITIQQSKWESVAEHQTDEQYSKQGKMKDWKHFCKIDWSPKTIKSFLSKPIFCAIEEETEQKRCSKVNLLSKITLRILKRVAQS